MPLSADKVNSIIAGMDNTRDKYVPLWITIAKYLTPESGVFYSMTKEDADNNLNVSQYKRIIDQTPIWALKTTIAGLFNALTPPSKKWFCLENSDDDYDDYGLTKDIERFIYQNLDSSDFYKLVPQALRELLAFGTFCSRRQYLPETIKFKLFTIGTYSIRQDSFGKIDGVSVKYETKVSEFEEEFGFIPEKAKMKKPDEIICFKGLAVKNYAGELDDKGLNREWIEYYIYDDFIFKRDGHKSNPFLVARFDLTQSAKGWGIGNGMRAIGNVMSLQQLLMDFCNAVEEQFDPSTIINQDLFQNGNISFEPGRQNYVSGVMGELKNAVTNARTISYNYEAFMALLTEFRTMAQRMLDSDIFLTISGARKNMTATEVASLEQEKLLRFGTLFQNITTEFLTPLVLEYVEYYYYVNNIKQKSQPSVKYFGLLSQAQKLEELQKIQASITFIASIAQFNPEILDCIKFDEIPEKVFRLTGLNYDLIRSKEDVKAIRTARAQAAQDQQAVQYQQQMQEENADIMSSLPGGTQ